ncbi:MAG: Ig-like domain-containing protein, partial [bacterium]
IFNRSKSFRTLTDGAPSGTLIEAVGTHEAGHVFGLSHSAVLSSTMYFVLAPDTTASTLATEDKLALFKAYATTADMAGASHLSGTIIDGYTGEPLAGAAVFAIDAADGDTVMCEYTLPHDGSYAFIGLPDGDYYIGIHPLNGSSSIGYIQPGYINHIIAASANTIFVPEWYDDQESQYDDSEARTAVSVYAGEAPVVVNLTTNIDDVGPVITSTVPAAGATGVSIGGSILVSFDEPVNSATLQGNFSLTNVATGEFAPGNAAFLNDDMLIAYVPSVGLEFSSQYRLTLGTGLQDLFGNGLDAPFEITFVTEEEPPVALTSLAPSKGTEGIIVSVNGKGFDPVPANNTVTFSGVPAPVSSASPTQLVVKVPAGATSGVVHVFNQIQGLQSNDLQFTILSTDEVPKGFESGVTLLGETPRAITVLPNGSYAFMATDAGVQAVVVDPSLGGYLTAVSLPVAGGLDDIDATPSGSRVYGVSWAAEMLYRIDATPGAIGVLSESPIGARPRGILVTPRGNHAFIPTDEGEIQIWDVDESSPSFLSQVGRVLTPDPNIRGEMATDPTGERLLALSGTGKLLVFDLVSKTLLEEIPVGPDPRDVAVDPLGRRAYVSDETGVVSIVSLEDYVTLQNIRTGGTLRGIAVTPGGAFAHAVNRELNILNAIDLRETSPTYRTVAATIPLPINPVDIEIAPDGEYAFTVSEAEQRLVVTTIGLGPSLSTISRSAGPAGAALVLSGSDFAADSAVVVSFDGVIAAPDRVSENSLTVSVPAGASSGPVSVLAVDNDGTHLGSNSVYFDVIGPTLDDALRLATTLRGEPSGTGNGGSVLRASPDGDFIALGDKTGGLHIVVTDRDKPGYYQYAGSMDLGAEAGDIAISLDGDRAFVVVPGAGAVRVVDVNALSDDFLTEIGAIDLSGVAGTDVSDLTVSPDGMTLLVSDPGALQVHFVDIAAGSPTEYSIVASVGLENGDINGVVHEMAYHPEGDYVYLPVHDSDPAVVYVMDVNPASPAFQTIVSTLTLPGSAPQEIPVSLSFTPNGDRCLVLTSGDLLSPNRTVVMIDTSDPASPVMTTTLPLGGTAPLAPDRIDVSPRGDRAVASVLQTGLFNIALSFSPDALVMIQQTGEFIDHLSAVGTDYAPDATVFYCLSESSDNLRIYDFSTVQNIAILSGDGQSGVINEPLPKPIRVQVSGSGGSVADVPVTFTVTSGGGYFSATGSSRQVVTTNDLGIAEAKWILGGDIGVDAHTAQAASSGLVGSPLTFTATGLDDPLTLPLTVTAVTPANDAQHVSVSTAIQVAFSRPINPSTISDGTLFLHQGDLIPIPVVFGFSDYYRNVSLSPRIDLEPTATYTIEITTGILDDAGEALAQPVTSVFMTEPLPEIALGSIAPTSGVRGAPVVLSGVAFNPDRSLNKVLFNGVEAVLRDASKDYIDAVVPLEAVFGVNQVRVVDSEIPDTSNALPFNVLDPAAVRADNVVADVKTGSATRSVAISPDGAWAYGVSPYANVVVPINLNKLVANPVIPMGENPVAVTLNPEGTLGYVANHVDGTVTIFDIDPESPDRHTVVDAIGVGLAPTDLAITPDGDRLVVVNYGSNDLSILDTDPLSATFHSVVANPQTASGTRTVAISPDGGLIYLGTNIGYMVLSATGYTVVSDVRTGSATRTVSVSPDGAFLFLLTTEGAVNIFDIHPESPTKDQVVASVNTDSGTRTVGISPDGGLLYLIQEASDIIIVASLDVKNAVSVIEDGTDLPPTRLSVSLIDTLTAGEDPSDIAFNPVTGEFIVANAGDNTISVFGPIGSMAGRVTTDSPSPGTGVPGIEVDAFEKDTGDLVATMITDDDGWFVSEMIYGDYVLTLVTPLGYTVAAEETLITFEPG